MNKKLENHHLTDKERLRLLNSIYVPHPQAQRILREIERAHTSREISEEPKCMSLIGSTGSGKSTLINQYMRLHPPSDKHKKSTVPIFKSVIPSDSTPKKFIRSILTSLYATMNQCSPKDISEHLVNDQDSDITKQRLYNVLDDLGVELIILDEFQHLVSSKSKRVLAELAATLKVLIIETQIPVIVVGTGHAESVFQADREVSRRFQAPMRIRPFMIDGKENISVFKKFLAEVDKLLPFEQLSEFASNDCALRFYAASNGFIDDIMRIVRLAGEYAIEESATKVGLEHLAEAFERSPGENHTASGNPFNSPIEKIESWVCIRDAFNGKITSAESTHKIINNKSLKDIF